VRLWLDGNSFADIASTTSRDINVLLRIHTRAIAYTLTTLVEQAVAIIARRLADDDTTISVAVARLPDYLRYGVTTPAARNLMTRGVRHRRAAILLGADQAMTAEMNLLRDSRDIANALIEANPDYWRSALGDFVYERTVRDLGANSGEHHS
jgi:hypothetical protein